MYATATVTIGLALLLVHLVSIAGTTSSAAVPHDAHTLARAEEHAVSVGI